MAAVFARHLVRNLERRAAAAAGQQAARSFIIRTLDDVVASGNVQQAATGTWESQRYMLRSDGCGFSMHRTILKEGTTTLIWYQNHVEAVYITDGEGTIELVEPGQEQGQGVLHHLSPGTMYVLNGQERHFLTATKGDLKVVCAFNPPIAGSEDHDDRGVYPAVDDDGVAHAVITEEVMHGKLTKPPASLEKGTPHHLR